MHSKIPDGVLARQRNPAGPAFYCPFCQRLVISPKNLEVATSLCPLCASMERHRVLHFLYKRCISDITKEEISVLHIAPENSLYKLLSSMEINYIAADLDPANFPFIPSSSIVQEDVLHLSFPDASFDVVLHNHVIEHVEDDIACLRENMRVLRQGGSASSAFLSSPSRSHFSTPPSLIRQSGSACTAGMTTFAAMAMT